MNQPHQVSAASNFCLSSLFLSNADRYLSYESRKDLSTRDENISSPRGFVVCGMDDIVEARATGGVGEGGSCGGEGRGKSSDSGLKRNFDRNGGVRTFKYMLNDRKALLACGTYLKLR